MAISTLKTAPAGTLPGNPCRVHYSGRIGRRVLNGGPGRSLFVIRSLVMFWCLAIPFSVAHGSPRTMKGPVVKRHQHPVGNELETSTLRIVLSGAVSVFQEYISPIDGDRCGFVPSCSSYARTAVNSQGVVLGITMAADRLMRCTLFKAPGPDYVLLPNGKLFDPIENNLLFNP